MIAVPDTPHVYDTSLVYAPHIIEHWSDWLTPDLGGNLWLTGRGAGAAAARAARSCDPAMLP